MAQSNKQAKKQMKNLTRDAKADRIKAAQEQAKREKEAKARKERMRKIFTVVVCVILVLALGIPTMALSVLQG